MGLSDLAAVVALVAWLLWCIFSAPRALEQINSGVVEARGASMRWGFRAGLLMAMAISVSVLNDLLAGRPVLGQLLLFALIGLASGPGLAFYLYRVRARRLES